jgi:RNA polymerase sigma-70 factor (ECF subfamily)
MEHEVLARLIDRHAAALVLYARQWCAGAEDVVQEALVRLAGQRTPPQNAAAWLFRTVRNGAISVARAEGRRRRHEADAARLREWFQADASAPVDATDAAQALDHLAQEEREVVVAHLWGGLTFEEIAEIAGCSSSTAHRRYLAGLAHLRELLGDPCPTTTHTNTTRSKPPCDS